jgi:hypothetical protein
LHASKAYYRRAHQIWPGVGAQPEKNTQQEGARIAPPGKLSKLQIQYMLGFGWVVYVAKPKR